MITSSEEKKEAEAEAEEEEKESRVWFCGKLEE